MDVGIEWIINGLNEVLDQDSTDVKIALETMAGKGNECGFTFEQLKNVLGAHKDRHENIGKGHIGFDILYSIVHHPKLENVTKILETPFIDKKAPYKEEISALR